MKNYYFLFVFLSITLIYSQSVPVYHNVTAPAINNKAERIAKFAVSDQYKDVLEIVNATEYNNRFKPTLWAHSEFNDNRTVFRIFSTLKSINDNGSNPIMMFQTEIRNSIYDSYPFPWGSNKSNVVNRPLFGWYNGNDIKMLMKANGNLGIGTTNPQEKLHINGSVRGNIESGALRIKSSTGYIDVGSRNSSWAHFVTDRSNFYFNKSLYVYSGAFSSYYTNDLKLQTNGTTRMTILKDNGNVGIGTTSPTAKLHNNGTVRFQNLPNGSGNPTYVLGTDTNGNVKEYNLSTSGGSDIDWLDTSNNTPDSIYDNIYTRGKVGINQVNPTHPLHITLGFTQGDPVKIEGVKEKYDPFMLTIDDSGVIHKIRISEKESKNLELITELQEIVKEQQKQIDELKSLILSKSSTVSFNEISESSLKVYPNPNEGNFIVDLNGIESGSFFVISANGDKVYEKIFSHQGQLEIDLKHLSSGTYMIVVESDNTIVSGKIIIK